MAEERRNPPTATEAMMEQRDAGPTLAQRETRRQLRELVRDVLGGVSPTAAIESAAQDIERAWAQELRAAFSLIQDIREASPDCEPKEPHRA